MWKKVMICAVVALILVPASVLAAGNMSGTGAEQGKAVSPGWQLHR